MMDERHKRGRLHGVVGCLINHSLRTDYIPATFYYYYYYYNFFFEKEKG